MTRKQRRLAMVMSLVCGLSVAAILMANAFEDTLVFFYSPRDVKIKNLPPGQIFRLGGMVEKGSLEKRDGGRSVQFVVTDQTDRMQVNYTGILPDLFREGQGVVAQGQMAPDNQSFIATEVLAKHDENYMPPEVARALKNGPDGQHGMDSLHQKGQK